MEENRKGYKYRWCIGGIWIFIILIQYMLPFAVAPLLTVIMEEYALDYTLGGMLVTIVGIIGGLSMFMGGKVVQTLGIKKGALTALILFLLGDLISVVAPSYPILMIGRVCIGVGYGLISALTGAMIMAWFPQKEQPFMNAANAVIGTLAQTAAYGITIPLYQMAGNNWHTLFGYFAVVVGATLIVWVIFGKSSPEKGGEKSSDAENKPENSAEENAGLAATWKRSEVKKLTAAAVGMFMAYTTVTTFFPSFLEETRGISAAQASVITGFVPMAGLVGSLLIGSLAGVTGRRRSIMWPMMALAVVGMVMASFSGNVVLITIGLCAIGFGASAYIPVIYTYLMELPGATPGMVASGVALTLGVANIANLFDSMIYNALASYVGLSAAFIPFGILLVMSMLVSMTLPEPKKESKK